MAKRVYSIKDVVAEEFGPLFFAKNDSVAKRNYLNQIPEGLRLTDYELWFVAEFDENEGAFNYDLYKQIVDVSPKIDEEVKE